MPVGMAMIYKLVPIEKRGLALGIWGISAMAAPAIGPTLSGYIIQYMNWRLIFTLNIPIGIVGITLAVLLLRETPTSKDKTFDIFGAITCAVGLFSLLLALSEGNSSGWTSIYILGLFALSIISLVSFIYIELHHKDPLLDLRILKVFPYGLSMIISTITTLGMYGALFLMPLYLQNLRGYSPMESGMLMLPAAVVTGIMMPISGKLFDKFGAKWLTIIGLSILTAASYFLSTLSMETSYNTVMVIMMVRGIGMGLSIMPAQTAGMNAIPRELSGRATALNSTVKQVAGSFGIAILTTVLVHREAFYKVKYSDIKQVTVAAIDDTLLVAALVCLAGIFVAFFIKSKTESIPIREMSEEEMYEQELVEESFY